MHWLQHSGLKRAPAWRLKRALREVYARAAASNDAQLARADLSAWLSWARRCRLEPFKKLARTLTARAEAVVRGMIDNRSNAFVEAMNGMLQQAMRAERGLRTATHWHEDWHQRRRQPQVLARGHLHDDRRARPRRVSAGQ